MAMWPPVLPNEAISERIERAWHNPSLVSSSAKKQCASAIQRVFDVIEMIYEVELIPITSEQAKEFLVRREITVGRDIMLLSFTKVVD